MKDLKDFIAENRSLFNREELPQGHQERFFNRLQQEESGKHRFFRRHRFLSIAAALFVLALGALGVTELLKDRASDKRNMAIHQEVNIEQKMLQDYIAKMNVLEQKINGYAAVMHSSDWEQIEYTVSLLTDTSYSLADALPPELAPEQRRTSLQAYYAQKLAGMRQIATLLAENQPNLK